MAGRIPKRPAQMQMTAVAMEILIWHYYHGSETSEAFASQSQIDASEYLCRNELLVTNNEDYDISERGQVLVDHWMNCPLPEKSWSMPK